MWHGTDAIGLCADEGIKLAEDDKTDLGRLKALLNAHYEEAEAATKIQAVHRGRRVRRRPPPPSVPGVESPAVGVEVAPTAEESSATATSSDSEAATRIQAVQRGRASRRRAVVARLAREEAAAAEWCATHVRLPGGLIAHLSCTHRRTSREAREAQAAISIQARQVM